MYEKLEAALAILDMSKAQYYEVAPLLIVDIGVAQQMILEYIEDGYKMNQEETTIGN